MGRRRRIEAQDRRGTTGIRSDAARTSPAVKSCCASHRSFASRLPLRAPLPRATSQISTRGLREARTAPLARLARGRDSERARAERARVRGRLRAARTAAGVEAEAAGAREEGRASDGGAREGSSRRARVDVATARLRAVATRGRRRRVLVLLLLLPPRVVVLDRAVRVGVGAVAERRDARGDRARRPRADGSVRASTQRISRVLLGNHRGGRREQTTERRRRAAASRRRRRRRVLRVPVQLLPGLRAGG